MKKLIFLIVLLILLNITISYSSDLYQEFSVNIEVPDYPVENKPITLKVYIENEGNFTFNGSTSIWVDNEKREQWTTQQYNITIIPQDNFSTEYTFPPTSPSIYQIYLTIKDDEDRQVYSNPYKTFRVHSTEEEGITETTKLTKILVVIGVLTFFWMIVGRKK